MIKAKDLRIDNWAYGSIRPTNEPKQIKDITLNICKLGEYLEGYESINPIPLTAEILLKCGFEKRKDGYYILALNHARMSIGFYAGVPDKMTLFQMQGLPSIIFAPTSKPILRFNSNRT